VRELRIVIDQLCVLRAGRVARVSDLPRALQAAGHATTSASSRARGTGLTMQIDLDQRLEATVDQIIARAVELEGGNRSRAAQRLGIGLRTVQRRLRGAAVR
jgi:DNA-binding NtrC family response regulator